MDIGLIYLVYMLGGKVSRQAVLPEQMLPFNFAFGLGRWCILETDPDPFQDFSQICEHVRQSAEEEAMEVHVQAGRQTVFFKGNTHKIKVCQQTLARIQSRSDHYPATVINHVKERLLIVLFPEPRVGSYIQLP